eukprot:5544893-Amphidinium_carterae.2
MRKPLLLRRRGGAYAPNHVPLLNKGGETKRERREGKQRQLQIYTGCIQEPTTCAWNTLQPQPFQQGCTVPTKGVHAYM